MARKNALVTVAMNDGTLTFTVGNDNFNLVPADLSDELRDRALVHGLVQKISDAAAIAKSELSGDPAIDAATKFNAMKSVAERLMSGDWSKRNGDGSAPVAGVIYRAFEEWVVAMAAKAKKDAPSAEAIRAKYDSLDRSGQLALRNVPAIAKIIERIKSERGSTAVSAIDTGSLLGELGL